MSVNPADLTANSNLARQGSMLVGLLGRGIALSQSPLMHEREGQRLGINYVYRRLDFDALDLADDKVGEVLDWCERLGYSGLNVTHPFKQAVLPHLDTLSSEAAGIEAVNTITFEDGRRTGHNTDCWGFSQSLKRGLPDARLDNVVLIGAGGAGRAVLQALADLGSAAVSVYDTDRERAERAASAMTASHPVIECKAVSDLDAAMEAATGVVNATPVGMAKYPGMPVSPERLPADCWVADIIYFPDETDLVRAARSIGHPVLSGGLMAVYQAVRAFELFTGLPADADAMAQARRLG